MSLSIGIVGLPNVGKSTLFNALLKRQAALADNYPFATIEPNVGIVPVPDERLAKLAEIVSTTVIKPATVEFVDIAGLVKGAHEGEGLGNQFLSHIREVDLICHVVRAFEDSNVIREGSENPLSDKETIETELLLADLSTLEKQHPPKGSKTKEELLRWEVITRLNTAAQVGQPAREVLRTPEEKAIGKELNLLTAKNTLYIVNVSEDELTRHQELTAEYGRELGVAAADVVIISARIESELSSLSDEDQRAYLSDLGLDKSGLERLIATAFDRLKLQTFLTAGELEVKAWTITQGTKAAQAAGVIHTDFEKHFIKAHVVSYDDFVTLGGWKKVRDEGKVRMEGRDYVMREGDVVEFMIGK